MTGRRETYSTLGQKAAIAKASPLAQRDNSIGTLNNSRRIAPSSKGNGSMPQKPEVKESVKYIVKYITKQIYICPSQPVLIVERLPYLEYHVNELTKLIGRRPRMYLQGKSVQLVPESTEEYGTIERYLIQLRVEEGIVWCSRSLPPGSGLKVNVVERVVKVVNIPEDDKDPK